jgi:protein TonB
MAETDIFSTGWCDLVFEDKNKNYGAFELRKNSSGRHLIALAVSSVLFVGGIMISRDFIQVNKDGKRLINVFSTPVNVDLTPPVDKVLNEIKSIAVKQADLRKTVKFTPPVITRDDSVKESDELKSQGELIRNHGLISSIDNENGSENPDAPLPGLDKQITGDENGDKPLIVVQQQPEFPGGMKALYQYLNHNLRYPHRAQENNIQGKVYVQFVVSKRGDIADIRIIKGVEESLDTEAIRLIGGMPAWNPGKNNGKPVATYFSLPIKFIIPE